MSNEHRQDARPPLMPALLNRVKHMLFGNWKIKLLSVLIALAIWGALMSEDASLTREKTFNDVVVTVTGNDALQRNGLVIVEGLDDLAPIKMRVDVPQKMYESAQPGLYSVRADVSRITNTGVQTVPIQTLSTTTYGAVSWLSSAEITVKVDEYVTRRRIPVRLMQEGQAPEGYYVGGVSVDPNNVVVSGPRSQVEKVAFVQASYSLGNLDDAFGLQYSAVPFKLISAEGREIDSKLISVTSENVLLDTLLIEQSVYPKKSVGINLSGILKGRVLEGYKVSEIRTDPALVIIAGNADDINRVTMLDLSSSIDVDGLGEPLIRALKIEKPAGVSFMSESAVYVMVDIVPIAPASGE